MITTYDKYIIQEKVEINIKDLVDKIKEEINKTKSAIIYSTITKDGEPVKVDGEYYALFYTENTDSKHDYFYTIGEVKILKKIEKSIEGSDKKTTAFVFKILSIDPFLEGKEKISDYKIYKSNKAKIKLGSNEITGFYLYSQEKTGADVKTLLKRYGLKGKSQDEKESNDIEVGSVYEVTNSKGNRVKIGVFNIEDGEITGRDFDNKNDIKNLKIKNIKNPKYVGTLFDILNPIQQELEFKNWVNSPEYKKLSNEEKISFIKEKIEKLNKLLGYTTGSMNSRNPENNISLDVKEDIKALRKSIKDKISVFNKRINALKKVESESKPKEPKEDVTETPEEKEVKKEIKDADNKAKEVQTDIQKPKKTVNKETVKQKKKELESVSETKNYKDFIDEKNKKL
jgi:hypothetical protein